MHDPLPFKDCTFDAVIAVRTLGHGTINELKEILIEIHRVTKKKGIFLADVLTYEKAVKLMEAGEKFNEVEEGTYIPLSGPEKDLAHHHFNKIEAQDFFFSVLYRQILFEESEDHYVIIGEKNEV